MSQRHSQGDTRSRVTETSLGETVREAQGHKPHVRKTQSGRQSHMTMLFKIVSRLILPLILVTSTLFAPTPMTMFTSSPSSTSGSPFSGSLSTRSLVFSQSSSFHYIHENPSHDDGYMKYYNSILLQY